MKSRMRNSHTAFFIFASYLYKFAFFALQNKFVFKSSSCYDCYDCYDLFMSVVKLINFRPINHVKKRLNIIRTTVLIVQVISVFPHI